MPKYLRKLATQRNCKNNDKNRKYRGEQQLIVKDSDNQVYGQVLKLLGNDRLSVFCFDGKQRLCRIRGAIRRIVLINVGDILLIGLRSYQDYKADVILKYSPNEVSILRNSGQLPEVVKLNGKDEIEIVYGE